MSEPIGEPSLIQQMPVASSLSDLRSALPAESLTLGYLPAYSNTADEQYPAALQKTKYGGYGMVATQALLPGTIVAKFTGPTVEYADCSEYDKRYVLLFLDSATQKWTYMLPMSNARFVDHQCSPNCIIDDLLRIVTVKEVQQGEWLGYIYNKGDEVQDEWDPVWTFQCGCGSEACQGLVDRYRNVSDPPLPAHVDFKLKSHVEKL